MLFNNNYHFKVNTFDCIVINDGTFAYPHPAQLLFANAPQEALEQALCAHNIALADWEVYVSPFPCLVINTGQQLVLVDTGAGNFAPSTGKLPIHLQREGIDPQDIDFVILTHAHPDHIGGVLDAAGRPAFRKARYFIGRSEWEFWRGDPDVSHLQISDHCKKILLESAQAKLPPLQRQIELVDADTEIVPGIRSVAAPGHTPGQLGLEIGFGRRRLLAASDAWVHPLHVAHPDWVVAFDYAPDQVVATRRRLLQLAASEEALVFATHFTLPCLGHIVPVEEGWQWQPLETIE